MKTSIARLWANRPNPYDFRTPIIEPRSLVGREEELDKAKKHIASTAAGRPVHIALIGERAAGKTSLLNAIQEEAEDQGLIAVRLDLDDATARSPFTFFTAMFEATVEALVRANALEPSDPRYRAWLSQITVGDSINPADELLRFGMVVAGALRGAQHDDVSPGLLRSDAERLAGIAIENDYKGFALVIDEADLIGQNAPLIQKLRNLFQTGVPWMLVAAGTKYLFSTLSDVFSPIPRQFDRIPVTPFDHPFFVARAVERPLEIAGLDTETIQSLRPNYRATVDIYEMTQGRPYEIALVCYYIWEALQGDLQREFALSPTVLDNVIEELAGIGLDASVDEVNAMRSLTDDQFETALGVLPYEELTPRELALSRLLPLQFSPAEFDVTLRKVMSDISELRDAGVLSVEHDRFHVPGGPVTRVYFKYQAQRHANVHQVHGDVRFESSFAELVAREFVPTLRRAIAGEASETPGLPWPRRTSEMGQREDVGRNLRRLAESLDARKFETALRSPFYGRGLRLISEPWADLSQEFAQKGLTFVGLVLTVGATHIEVAELFYNEQGLSSAEVTRTVNDWVDANSDRLRLYDTSVTGVYTAALAPLEASELVAHLRLLNVNERMFARWEEDDLQGALDVLSDAIDYLENEAKPSDEQEALSQDRRLADWLSKFGFISSGLGRAEVAGQRIRQSLALSDHQKWLNTYNLSYVAALTGDYREAARLAQEALAEFRTILEDASPTVIFMHFPTTNGWSPLEPKWNLADLPEDWIEESLGLQVAVYEALLGNLSEDDFRSRVLQVSSPAVPTIYRLAAWTLLSVFGDSAGAIQYFEKALPLRDDEDVADQELHWARAVTKDPDAADND